MAWTVTNRIAQRFSNTSKKQIEFAHLDVFVYELAKLHALGANPSGWRLMGWHRTPSGRTLWEQYVSATQVLAKAGLPAAEWGEGYVFVRPEDL